MMFGRRRTGRHPISKIHTRECELIGKAVCCLLYVCVNTTDYCKISRLKLMKTVKYHDLRAKSGINYCVYQKKVVPLRTFCALHKEKLF